MRRILLGAAALFALAGAALAQTPSVPRATINGVTAGCGLAGGGTIGNVELDSSIGYNPQLANSYTVLTGDCGKLVSFSNLSSVAVTLPQAGSTGFEAGWNAVLTNYGPGTVTVTPTVSTIGGATTLSLPSGFGAQVVSDGSNWQVSGNLSTIALGTVTLISDVTGSGALGSSISTTITDGAVRNSMLAPMPNSTVKGNVSGGATSPSDLTATQLTTLVNTFTSTLSGAAPASGGGTTNFLRADGAWTAPTSPSSAEGGTLVGNRGTTTDVITASSSPILGNAGVTSGSLGFRGTTSGTVTVQPQAAAGTYNFNLPTSAGSSGQPLLSGGGGATAMSFGTLGVDAGGTGATTLTSNNVILGNGTSAVQFVAPSTSGNVLTSNGTTWISTATSVKNDMLLYQEQRSSGTTGPTYSAAGWRTVQFSTEVIDTGGIGSLSANAITLAAGSYEFEGFVAIQAGSSLRARLRLQNTSDGSTILQGVQETLGYDATPTGMTLAIVGSFTIAASKTLELQIYPTDATVANQAMTTGDSEIYTALKFRRFAQ
jgi:hypothetical protein